MFRIEEIFKNDVIDEFAELRNQGAQSVILKENNFDNSAIQQELLKSIEQIQNEESKKQILQKLEDFEESMNEEMTIFIKNFYKIGFVDGILFVKDIKKILELLKNNNDKK